MQILKKELIENPEGLVQNKDLVRLCSLISAYADEVVEKNSCGLPRKNNDYRIGIDRRKKIGIDRRKNLRRKRLERRQ